MHAECERIWACSGFSVVLPLRAHTLGGKDDAKFCSAVLNRQCSTSKPGSCRSLHHHLHTIGIDNGVLQERPRRMRATAFDCCCGTTPRTFGFSSPWAAVFLTTNVSEQLRGRRCFVGRQLMHRASSALLFRDHQSAGLEWSTQSDAPSRQLSLSDVYLRKCNVSTFWATVPHTCKLIMFSAFPVLSCLQASVYALW